MRGIDAPVLSFTVAVGSWKVIVTVIVEISIVFVLVIGLYNFYRLLMKHGLTQVDAE